MKLSRRAFSTALVIAGLLAPTVAMSQASDDPIVYAIATGDLNIGYPFATLANALGYFEEEGLNVEVVPGQSSAAVAQLLVAGRAQLGVAQPNPSVAQRANNGVPLVSVYAISRHGTSVFVVRPDSPIQTIADIEGKTIGVADMGSSDIIYLRAKLLENGLTEEDVTIIATGYGTPAFEALSNGTVDATITFTGGLARMLVAGYEARALPMPESERDLYSYNLYATQDYIDANPEVIGKIGRAMAKATVFLRTSPEAAVRVFWNQYPDRAPRDLNDPEAMERDLAIITAQAQDMAAFELPADFAWGSQEVEVFARIQDYLVATEQISTPQDPAVFFTSQFEEEYNDFDRAPIEEQARTWTAE